LGQHNLNIHLHINQNEDLEEKKLLGSGGHAFAKLTEQEEIKASLGVPQIFLSNVWRLSEDRFTKYLVINMLNNILVLEQLGMKLRKNK
jgi:hypothetical protein